MAPTDPGHARSRASELVVTLGEQAIVFGAFVLNAIEDPVR
jgi:hypothetical protein